MRSPMIVLVWLSLVPASSTAETWYVNPDGTGDFPDIQSAVNAATDGDEILLTDGMFSGPGNYRVDFLGKAITIRSASGNASACMIAFPYHPAFDFSGGEGPSSVVSDLTLLNTAFVPSSRAIRAIGASPTIRGVTFRSTFYAIWSEGGSLRLEDSILEDGCNLFFCDCVSPVVTGCVLEAGSLVASRGRVRVYDSSVLIEDCSLDDGGEWGGLVLGNSSGEISACEFLDSRIGAGGDAIDVLFEDCSIVGNRGFSFGGDGSNFAVRGCTIRSGRGTGVNVSGNSQLTLEGCDIRGNNGPGVFIYYRSRANIRDCLIAGNEDGGVAAGHADSVNIEDCTIASNGRTSHWGGGLCLAAGPSASVLRTILWGNCADYGPAAWVADGCTLVLECVNALASDIAGDGTIQIVGDLLEEDPAFCDPLGCTQAPSVGGDYTLHQNSPALNQQCGVMGGQGPGCGPISVISTSWGNIKALYR